MSTTETLQFSPRSLKSLFSVSEELQSLIGSVKQIAAITTLEEVLIGLKVYICKKQLFDPYNPIKISCKNDELGSVFGVAEFTLHELRNILQKLIKPIDRCSVNSYPEGAKTISDSSTKRTLDETEETTRKRKCSASYSPVCTCNNHSPMLLYIPTSPIPCDTSDLDKSDQGYETTCVKHSRNEDVWSMKSESGVNIVAEERIFDAEYDSDNDSDIDSGSKSDDEAIVTFMCRSDSDVEFWADHSSEDESEISRPVMWECDGCHSLNKPMRRSCLRCWNQRPNWLPENEKKLKKQKALLRRKRQRSIIRNNVYRSDRGSANSTQESSPSSQEIANTAATQRNIMCIICQKKPANASIVHSRFAHQIACYECAKQLKKKKERCPACRRTIDKVVYQVTAF